MTRHPRFSLSAALISSLLLAACAASPENSDDATINDPLEGLNRGIYSFNNVVDDAILQPVARLYRVAVPAPGREGVKNFLNNLSAPVVFINNVLQGDVPGAFTTFWRFVLNTTLGFGGVYDFASNNTPLAYRPEDFGQTLGVWGVGSGAYLVLPILGPSSLRDGTGRVVDYASDPFTYLLTDGEQIARYGATAIDGRSRSLDLVDEIERTSLDPYATIRSAYLQRRESLIENKGKSDSNAQSFGPVSGTVEDAPAAQKAEPHADAGSANNALAPAAGTAPRMQAPSTNDAADSREDSTNAARSINDGMSKTNTNAYSGTPTRSSYGRLHH